MEPREVHSSSPSIRDVQVLPEPPSMHCETPHCTPVEHPVPIFSIPKDTSAKSSGMYPGESLYKFFFCGPAIASLRLRFRRSAEVHVRLVYMHTNLFYFRRTLRQRFELYGHPKCRKIVLLRSHRKFGHGEAPDRVWHGQRQPNRLL